MNWFKQTNLSREVLAALIGALVLITGYIYNSHVQREQEKFIRKLQAFENALSQIELLVGSQIDDDIRKLNSSIAILMLSAPDNVVKRINDEVIKNRENEFDRDDFRQLQLILHEDLHGKSEVINYGHFPSFTK